MLRQGETFVYGRTKDQAQALLAAADEIGVDAHTIRATDNGFICPDAVWDRVEQIKTETWTNDKEAVF